MGSDNRICVGVITGAYGVRGEARIKSFCAEPSAIADYSPLSSENGKTQYPLTITRPVKGGFAARLGGVFTKEHADSLKGEKLYAQRRDLPSLPDDEYYYADLIGLDVLDTGGQNIGRISAVHDHGAGDILEIAAADARGSFLVPFTRDVVPTIDQTARRAIIDLPDGVMPEASDAK